jgi:hypothetical protein
MRMLFLVVCASVKLTLTPGSLRVVGKLEDVLLGESGTSEQLKSKIAQYPCSEVESSAFTHSETSGCVTTHGPSPSLVQTGDTLIADQLDDTSTSESLGVGLHLDLEHVEGEQDLKTATRANKFSFTKPREYMLG